MYSCFKLTIDESKAEPGQNVLVQIFISVLSVPLPLNSPPAQHNSNEHQVITVAGAAQSLFCLDANERARLDFVFCSYCKTTWIDGRVVKYFTLLTCGLFSRLLRNGSLVRQAATDSMGRTHLNMALRISTLPSRGSHDIQAMRSPKGVKVSVLSRTPTEGNFEILTLHLPHKVGQMRVAKSLTIQ